MISFRQTFILGPNLARELRRPIYILFKREPHWIERLKYESSSPNLSFYSFVYCFIHRTIVRNITNITGPRIIKNYNQTYDSTSVYYISSVFTYIYIHILIFFYRSTRTKLLRPLGPSLPPSPSPSPFQLAEDLENGGIPWETTNLDSLLSSVSSCLFGEEGRVVTHGRLV